MEKVRKFLRERPRILAVILLLVGIGMSFYLVDVYKNGRSFKSSETGIPPICIIFGIAGLIEPRLLTVWDGEKHPSDPPIYKMISIVVAAVAIAIGLYLGFVVFKDWKPAV